MAYTALELGLALQSIDGKSTQALTGKERASGQQRKANAAATGGLRQVAGTGPADDGNG